MTETVICPDCGKKVKNLGAHKYHTHKKVEQEIDNYIEDKPLSELVDKIRELLRSYPRTTFAVSSTEECGVVGRIDLAIGIQRR